MTAPGDLLAQVRSARELLEGLEESLAQRIPDSDEANATGKALVAGSRWPRSIRFDLNPRLSDDEETFLSALVDRAVVDEATAKAVLIVLREIGFEVRWVAYIPEPSTDG